jgi:hypothetical protein
MGFHMEDKKLKIKKCCGQCPKCGAGEADIRWALLTVDDFPRLSGTCRGCGCKFSEVYKYDHTIIEE